LRGGGGWRPEELARTFGWRAVSGKALGRAYIKGAGAGGLRLDRISGHAYHTARHHHQVLATLSYWQSWVGRGGPGKRRGESLIALGHLEKPSCGVNERAHRAASVRPRPTRAGPAGTTGGCCRWTCCGGKTARGASAGCLTRGLNPQAIADGILGTDPARHDRLAVNARRPAATTVGGPPVLGGGRTGPAGPVGASCTTGRPPPRGDAPAENRRPGNCPPRRSGRRGPRGNHMIVAELLFDRRWLPGETLIIGLPGSSKPRQRDPAPPPRKSFTAGRLRGGPGPRLTWWRSQFDPGEPRGAVRCQSSARPAVDVRNGPCRSQKPCHDQPDR